MRWEYFFILVFCACFAYPQVYYVCDNSISCGGNWSTGNDVNSCTSRFDSCKTIAAAISKMSGNDTLLIGNGTYIGSNNMMNTYEGTCPPEGSPEKYTIVKAEYIGGVVIDGEYARIPILIRGDDTGIGGAIGTSPSHDYIEINGIYARNSPSSGAITIYYVNHIKVLNSFASDGADGNAGAITIGSSSNLLIENSSFWGNGRYTLFTGAVMNMVIRNCVVRHDRSNPNGDPMGGIINYGNANVDVQNCIVIDSDQSAFFVDYTEDQGAFGNPGTSSRSASGPVKITNSIALNNHLRFGTSDWGQYRNNVTHKNCIGWDINLPESTPGSGSSTSFYGSKGDSSFVNCTFGKVKTYDNDSVSAHFWGWNGGLGVNENLAKNNIYHDLRNGDLFLEWEVSENHVIYNLTSGFEIDDSSSANGVSTNISIYDSTVNGLSYLPRVESSSNLSSNGVGANIQYMYGKPGTMFGETGYNILQDGTDGQDEIDLWPFPNEGIIKKHMQSYFYTNGTHNISGNRGFAANGTGLYGGPITLTSYIWEYLGNPCPDEICTYGGSYSYADLNTDNIINTSEVRYYISEWMGGSAQLGDLTNVIDIWKWGGSY